MTLVWVKRKGFFGDFDVFYYAYFSQIFKSAWIAQKIQ